MEKESVNPKLQHLRGSIQDALTINLHILGQTMNLTIERSEEELYRKAERLINLRYNMYASLYAESRDKNRFAAMTLLDIALMAQKAEFVQSDVITKLAELGNKIASDLTE
jgi:cell division protein ZapA